MFKVGDIIEWVGGYSLVPKKHVGLLMTHHSENFWEIKPLTPDFIKLADEHYGTESINLEIIKKEWRLLC